MRIRRRLSRLLGRPAPPGRGRADRAVGAPRARGSTSAKPASPAAGSTPGRVLHLVLATRLDRDSGSSMRTHMVGLAQRRAGLDPWFLTSQVVAAGEGPTAPRTGGWSADPRHIDGVPYLPSPIAAWDVGSWSFRLARKGQGTDAEHAWREAMAAAGTAAIEQLRPAVLHATTPYRVGRVAARLARSHGLPWVYEVRGFLYLDDQHHMMRRYEESKVMGNADAVVAIGHELRTEILACGVPDERVVVVPNAVDLDRFVPQPRDDALAASLGIPPGTDIVGYVTSFQPYEDFDAIIDAVRLLRERGRSVVGLLVGDGRVFEEVRERVRSAGLADVILLPGRVPHEEVPRYVNLIDVFVVARPAAARTELTTPLKQFEPMACARAVVVARTKALLEVVPPAVGRSYLPGDAADLADVVDDLLAHPDERRRIGAAAREWVIAERGLDGMGRTYRSIYERLGAL